MVDELESVNSRKRASGVDRANERLRIFRATRRNGARIGRLFLVAAATAWGLSSCAGSQESGVDRAADEVRTKAAAPDSPQALTPDASSGSPVAGDVVSSAQAYIASREYWASESSRGLQAPNRAQGLRSYFDPTGVRVHDRAAAGGPALVELRLAGVGRGEAIEAVGAGEVVPAENRVEIRRAGIVEWFVNTRAGLEQGFTVAIRPSGSRTQAMVVELAVGGGAKAALREDRVILSTGTHRPLTYEKLSVVDANGVSLAARFEVPTGNRIRLVVDDAGAAYPIVIDPILSNLFDMKFETLELGSLTGTSVASVGDFDGDGLADMVIGAPSYDGGSLDEGAAFVFLGSTDDVVQGSPATAHAILTSSQTGSGFGGAVASAGDVNGDGLADVIVGASLYDAGRNPTNEGAAFVFLGSSSPIANGTPATAHASFLSNQANMRFGYSVATAGDVNGDGYSDVLVGAEGYDIFAVPANNEAGAAFVFLGSSTGLASGTSATAHAQLESAQTFALFGRVASAGDVNGDGFDDVIVGAPQYDAGQSNEGAVFVFLGSAAGIASASSTSAHARFESNEAGASLGVSVASTGDINADGHDDVIVGASLFNAGRGAAFLFHGSATGFVNGNPTTANASFDSGVVGSGFGESVASAGDVNGDGYADFVIGAPTYDGIDGGAVFVFEGSATGTAGGSAANPMMRLSLGDLDDRFGHQVAGAGDVNGDGFGDVIVGVPGYDFGPIGDHGIAFVFRGGAEGIVGGTELGAATTFTRGEYGLPGVLSAGDLNADGFDDLIASDSSWDGGEVDEGAVFVFMGRASAIPSGHVFETADAQLEGNVAGALFGTSLAAAGDVDRDGYADIIVGAPGYVNGSGLAGAAFIFRGSATGIGDGGPSTASTRIESNALYAVGRSVSGVGDVNGDGFAEIVLGTPGSLSPFVPTAVFMYHGRAGGITNGFPSNASTRIDVEASFAEMIGRGRGAGDVDGDGYADVIVFADHPSGVSSDAAIFHGRAAGIRNGWSPFDADSALGSGRAGSVGDVNGDGFSDIAIVQASTLRIWHGRATGIDVSAPSATIIQHPGYSSNLLFSRAGDLNADGYGDLIVGAPSLPGQDPFYPRGAAFVFHGRRTGIGSGDFDSASARIVPTRTVSLMGVAVAEAGDVNGDGYGDVLVFDLMWVPQFPSQFTGQGAVYLFLGNGGGTGLPVQAQQRRVPDPTSFEVELKGRHPKGEGRIRAEVEVCPSGTTFGAPPCTMTTSPGWVAVGGGAPASALVANVSGLSLDTTYQWRARVLQAPASGPIPANPQRGPWRRLGAQAVEGNFRTVPEPGVAGSIGLAVALLGGWARARGGRRARS